MDEKTFWIAIRAALLGIVSAIERRYSIGRRFDPGEDDSVTPPPKFAQS
jgi:hypothetical protein